MDGICGILGVIPIAGGSVLTDNSLKRNNALSTACRITTDYHWFCRDGVHQSRNRYSTALAMFIKALHIIHVRKSGHLQSIRIILVPCI